MRLGVLGMAKEAVVKVRPKQRWKAKNIGLYVTIVSKCKQDGKWYIETRPGRTHHISEKLLRKRFDPVEE